MAFNWQTFKTRTITSIVFAAVMLTGLLWNQWSFFILFTIIHFGCWWEYQKLIGLIDKGYQQINWFRKYGVMIAGWCIMLYFTGNSYNIFNLQLHDVGKWAGPVIFFLLIVNEIWFVKNKRPKNIGHSIFGLVYISLSWGLMMNFYREIDIHIHDTMFIVSDRSLPCLIIFSIWINDTMAYLIGSIFGKTQISKISPKKTWEGTIGGIILCVTIIGLICFLRGDEKILTILAITVSIIASVVGTFGDFLESKLKRMAGLKDSGSFMPGFGGFLDRFDSMLLAIPAVWLIVYFFMR